MTNIKVISKTQRIIVNPATSSVSVINAGPMGPPGAPGSSGASDALTVNGQLLTRFGGALAGITREQLAADPAFTDQYGSVAVGPDPPVAPDDGDLWWDTDEPSLQAGLVDPAALAANAAFTAKYALLYPRIGGTWRRTAAHAINNNANTPVTWDTEDADTPAGHINAPGTTYTVLSGEGGLYNISTRIGFSANPVGGYIQIICANAGQYTFFPGNAASVGGAASISGVPLVAGETVIINLYQSSGGALTFTGRLDIWRGQP